MSAFEVGNCAQSGTFPGIDLKPTVSPQVTVTPPRGGQPKRRTESREPTLVMLGPFTPKATVIFEGVPVGKTARRQLVVRNPYDGEIKVSGRRGKTKEKWSLHLVVRCDANVLVGRCCKKRRGKSGLFGCESF